MKLPTLKLRRTPDGKYTAHDENGQQAALIWSFNATWHMRPSSGISQRARTLAEALDMAAEQWARTSHARAIYCQRDADSRTANMPTNESTP